MRKVVKWCWRKELLVFMDMWLYQPDIVVHNSLMINSSKEIISFIEILSVHLLIIRELSLLQPNCPSLFKFISKIGVFIVFCITYCIHRMHLPESNNIGVLMIIVIMLVIYPCAMLILIIPQVYFKLSPFLGLEVKKPKIIDELLLLCIETTMHKHHTAKDAGCVIHSLSWCTLDFRFFKPLLSFGIIYMDIVEA